MLSFAKARAPKHFADRHVLIDEAHARGHTNCRPNHSTGELMSVLIQDFTVKTQVCTSHHHAALTYV